METTGTIFTQISDKHNTYLGRLREAIAAHKKEEHLTNFDRIDRVAFHVIEEIIEMRRTYPHKFWKQSEETFDKDLLLEEAADIFLMSRSMYLEIMRICGVSEEDFLKEVLRKVEKNQRRLENGY